MAEKAQGITAITVGGYKSIRDETTIEIRPLTILAGANSSGKSSIMQPLLMMKQTLDATYDPGPLLINGPNVRFTKFEQLKPKAKKGTENILAVGYRNSQDAWMKCEFKFVELEKRSSSIQLHRLSSNLMKPDFEIYPGMSRKKLLQQIPEEFQQIVREVRNNRDDNPKVKWDITSERCFLYVGLFESISVSGAKNRYEYPVAPFNPHPHYEGFISHLIHVPGLRGRPERTYPLAPVQGPRYPGHFNSYAGSLLMRWREESDDRLDQVERELSRLELTRWVKPERVDDANVEIQVGRLPVSAKTNPKEDLVSIADVGIGVSQILPVLVALAAADRGQLVYVEQPEMHLHPRAQVALARVLAEAAKRGVCVVAETHSSLLLQGIMTLIAQDKLDHEDVMLHWFKRDDEEGYTKVEIEEPDRNGAYGKWPEDFGDVELGIQGQYLDAVAKREFAS